MDSETGTRHGADLLESVLLDRNAEPIYVSLSLLEDITNGFSNEHQIGKGGFAVVYKGIAGKGMVAVKKLSTFSLHEDKFNKEVECLIKARHKNIVRFVGYCSDTQKRIADAGGKFVMAEIRNWLLCFEYVPNGSLDKYITDVSCGLEWRERYGIIKGICEGLLHLHERRILHLDLKPGNILLDDHMLPKITDFGLSKCLDTEQTRAFTSNIYGSLGYLAPEFFSGEVAFVSDIYSLGVIILEILTGKKGYTEDEKVIDNWMNRLEGSDQWDMQLEQIRVCIKIGIECMNLDPKKRPVARRIVDRLDEAAITVETSISISSVEQQVSFRKEQNYQEETTKLASEYPGKDKLEQAEIEETVGYVVKPREDHWQQGQEKALSDRWASWGAKGTKQNVSPQDARISSSNPVGRYDPDDDGPSMASAGNLEDLHRSQHIEFLKSSNIILKDDIKEVCEGLVTSWRLGQYCLLQDLDATNRISNIIHYCTLGLVDKSEKGRKRELSRHMMESIIDAFVQSQGHLAYGARSLRNHQMLSWACQAIDDDDDDGEVVVTHNILVWHVATTICKHKFEAAVAKNRVKEMDYNLRNAMDTASGLSKYCTYLVAFLPELLPGHCFLPAAILNKSVEKARNVMTLHGAKTMDSKCEILLNISYNNMHMDDLVIATGTRLAIQLMDIKMESRWEVLSNFWAEMILYVALPLDYFPEKEGEFITHLWALLMHAGVLEPGPDRPPNVDASSV